MLRCLQLAGMLNYFNIQIKLLLLLLFIIIIIIIIIIVIIIIIFRIVSTKITFYGDSLVKEPNIDCRWN